MRRKVIKQGNNTLTITLPKEWTSKYKIKPGDELDLEESESSLVVSSQKQASLNRIQAKLEGQPLVIRRYLGNLYRKGYDEIDLVYDEPKVFRMVQEFIHGFIGMEIIKQGKNSCTIKNVADIHIEDFDTILNRMFLLTLTMADDFYEAIEAGDSDILRNIIVSEKNHNRLFNCCLRIMNKKGTTLNKNLYFVSKLLIRLEDIGDVYRDMSNYIMKEGVEISSKFKLLVNDINSYLRKYYEFYCKFDEKKANYFLENKNKFLYNGKLMLENSSKKEIFLVHLALVLVDDIYEGVSPVFGFNF